MKLSKSGWSYSYKTVIPVTCTIILFVFTISAMIFSFREHIIEEKKIKIRELVETTWAILDDHNRQVLRGEISLKGAQKRVIRITSSLRYGPEMKDYFWITDMHPRQLMHPYHKVPFGYDLSEYKDRMGNRLFVKMRDIVKNNGSGYHTYYWQWKDHPGRVVSKISYLYFLFFNNVFSE